MNASELTPSVEVGGPGRLPADRGKGIGSFGSQEGGFPQREGTGELLLVFEKGHLVVLGGVGKEGAGTPVTDAINVDKHVGQQGGIGVERRRRGGGVCIEEHHVFVRKGLAGAGASGQHQGALCDGFSRANLSEDWHGGGGERGREKERRERECVCGVRR